MKDIETEVVAYKQGRNKLYNIQVQADGPIETPIGEVREAVEDAMLKKDCKGGEVINKTLTMRFYPSKKSKFSVKAMAMVRPGGSKKKSEDDE